MNYYVVEQEKNALDAVNLLSESSKGKANFFILAAFENFNAAEIKTIPNAKHALELVEFEDKYRKLIEYVLNDVYLITENQEVLPISEGVFITLNGKIAKKKFSISGGSVGLFEGKRIGRAKNLEKLEDQIKNLTTKQIEIKKKLNDKIDAQSKLKESTFANEIDATKKAINLLQNELVSVVTKKEQLESVLSTHASKTEDIQDKIVNLTEQISLHQPKVDEANKIWKETEEQINTVNKDLVAHNELLSEKSNTYNQENINFHQQSNKISSLEQEISYKQAAFEGSKARIEKNTAELRKIEEEIKNMVNNAEITDEELVGMYKEKEAIEGGLSEAEKEYYNNRGTIDSLEKEAKEIQKQREQVDTNLVDLNNKINEEKIGLTSIKERISVEFEVNIDKKEEEELRTDLSEKELKHKIDLTKNSLERLGPINPMAMEAYNEIKERHTFISTQKTDLKNAKKSLMDTINEIDTVAKATFLEAFTLIRENFIKVFRSLFSEEDSCDLRLADPSNPSESAIEITAKPKGKRPLTINQLSGGEKTLTAISLLFAIYLLKPAPFCIFDEVDAPLDDANIDKFNNIIRKFSDESQFIIVTHNKRTMASTDIIYGVTMVEPGVSRVVPVDLRSLD
jgi:chromosome segregation protein